MPKRDELDLLIDSALRDYAEPRAGLEQRMLARVSGEAARPSRHRWFLVAILGMPALAALIILGYLIPKAPHSQPGQMAYTPAEPSTSRVEANPLHRPVQSPSVAPIRRTRDNKHRVVQSAIQRPKLDIFPTPRPLTREEQDLSSFAAQAPEADRKALVAAQLRVDEPLNISAIRIPPLQSPEENH